MIVLPIFAVVYSLAYYISCSATRDLQRLEATSRSPIFTQFSETLNGLSTIRAFGATKRFERQSLTLVAANTRCFFNQDLASQWVGLRLDFMSAIIAGKHKQSEQPARHESSPPSHPLTTHHPPLPPLSLPFPSLQALLSYSQQSPSRSAPASPPHQPHSASVLPTRSTCPHSSSLAPK